MTKQKKLEHEELIVIPGDPILIPNIQNDEYFKQMVRYWRRDHNDLRFGQWLWNLLARNGKWQSPEANALFYIEDDKLAKLIENENKKNIHTN